MFCGVCAVVADVGELAPPKSALPSVGLLAGALDWPKLRPLPGVAPPPADEAGALLEAKESPPPGLEAALPKGLAPALPKGLAPALPNGLEPALPAPPNKPFPEPEEVAEPKRVPPPNDLFSAPDFAVCPKATGAAVAPLEAGAELLDMCAPLVRGRLQKRERREAAISQSGPKACSEKGEQRRGDAVPGRRVLTGRDRNC